MQRLLHCEAASAVDPFDRFATAVLPPNLPDALRRRFQALARSTTAAAGEAAIADDDVAQMVFLASGATKLVAHASQGREQVVAFHFSGDLVSVPAREAHAYMLCALVPSEFVTFPLDAFLSLARGEAAVMDAVLGRAMTALARSREKAITLGRKTAQERVASFLVVMAERTGKRGGSPHDSACILDLPMSRRDIADSLGLTIETISRQLGELRDVGLIETSGRSIVRLLDLPGLDERAGHLPAAA